MPVKALLKAAITQRHLVSFTYKGHVRIAEPYHYGKMLKNPNNIAIKSPSNNFLLVYQVAGTSSSGKMGFKCINLKHIKQLKIHAQESFTVRNEYNAQDSKWAIVCGVKQI